MRPASQQQHDGTNTQKGHDKQGAALLTGFGVGGAGVGSGVKSSALHARSTVTAANAQEVPFQNCQPQSAPGGAGRVPPLFGGALRSPCSGGGSGRCWLQNTSL